MSALRSTLWFIQAADQSHLFDSKQSQEHKDRLLDIIAANFRVDRDKIANNPALFEAIDADSPDVVELVMELEEELDMP